MEGKEEYLYASENISNLTISNKLWDIIGCILIIIFSIEFYHLILLVFMLFPEIFLSLFKKNRSFIYYLYLN